MMKVQGSGRQSIMLIVLFVLNIAYAYAEFSSEIHLQTLI